MLAEKYRKIGVNKLNVKAVNPTKAVRELVSILIESPELKIIYAPRSEWGGKNNPSDFLGAWVVSMNAAGEIQRQNKLHGRTINALFDNGIIEVDRNKQIPDSRIALFKLSKAAKENVRDIQRNIIIERNKRVTRDELNTFASQFGLAINYNVNRGLFEVLHADGSPLPSNGNENTYILQSSECGPVTRLNDLDWIGWFDALSFHSRNKLS